MNSFQSYHSFPLGMIDFCLEILVTLHICPIVLIAGLILPNLERIKRSIFCYDENGREERILHSDGLLHFQLTHVAPSQVEFRVIPTPAYRPR